MLLPQAGYCASASARGPHACSWLLQIGRTSLRVQSLWPDNRSLLLNMATTDAERLVRGTWEGGGRVVGGHEGCVRPWQPARKRQTQNG